MSPSLFACGGGGSGGGDDSDGKLTDRVYNQNTSVFPGVGLSLILICSREVFGWLVPGPLTVVWH
jgi:hypothetical protein